MLAMALLAPVAAGLLQMALSRSREFEADRTGAELIGIIAMWVGFLIWSSRFRASLESPFGTALRKRRLWSRLSQLSAR